MIPCDVAYLRTRHQRPLPMYVESRVPDLRSLFAVSHSRTAHSMHDVPQECVNTYSRYSLTASSMEIKKKEKKNSVFLLSWPPGQLATYVHLCLCTPHACRVPTGAGKRNSYIYITLQIEIYLSNWEEIETTRFLVDPDRRRGWAPRTPDS